MKVISPFKLVRAMCCCSTNEVCAKEVEMKQVERNTIKEKASKTAKALQQIGHNTTQHNTTQHNKKTEKSKRAPFSLKRHWGTEGRRGEGTNRETERLTQQPIEQQQQQQQQPIELFCDETRPVSRQITI